VISTKTAQWERRDIASHFMKGATDSVNQDNCFIHIMHYDNLDVAYHIAYYTLRQN